MAKWAGKVLYVETKETVPGVWVEQPTERFYYGDILTQNRRLESSGNLNDDINVSNRISIVADPYAYDHFHNMRSIEFEGARWKITSVEVQRPRLILTLGGVANVEQT